MQQCSNDNKRATNTLQYAGIVVREKAPEKTSSPHTKRTRTRPNPERTTDLRKSQPMQMLQKVVRYAEMMRPQRCYPMINNPSHRSRNRQRNTRDRLMVGDRPRSLAFFFFSNMHAHKIVAEVITVSSKHADPHVRHHHQKVRSEGMISRLNTQNSRIAA